jgi:argininosuccinate lyase
MAGSVATLQFDVARMAAAAPEGYALATEIAEWLVVRGVPFRQAHEISGAAVQVAESRSVELSELTDEELAQISEHLDGTVRQALDPHAAIAARARFGGTAPARVREQLAALRQQLEVWSKWAQASQG